MPPASLRTTLPSLLNVLNTTHTLTKTRSQNQKNNSHNHNAMFLVHSPKFSSSFTWSFGHTKLALWHMNAVQWQISYMEFMKPSIEFSARLVGVQTNENKVSSLVLHGEKPVNKYGMYTSLNTSELMLL